ncbi:hypothetical protein D3227_33625 [Mesorhizobium waimense]|uniref:Uncharacterized protein n=1 Tax=Mesorhizobium waimense TaxID=1300307 RepID=A0A3A5K0D5_9HYPH|nr:hypothetical protein D3227_33625 [Mesorhizobium waimense]
MAFSRKLHFTDQTWIHAIPQLAADKQAKCDGPCCQNGMIGCPCRMLKPGFKGLIVFSVLFALYCYSLELERLGRGM